MRRTLCGDALLSRERETARTIDENLRGGKRRGGLVRHCSGGVARRTMMRRRDRGRLQARRVSRWYPLVSARLARADTVSPGIK